MDEVRKPLFIAPVDLKQDDQITLFFGKPVLIERNGVEIWREDGITDDILQIINSLYQAAQKDQNEGATIIEIIIRTGDDATLL